MKKEVIQIFLVFIFFTCIKSYAVAFDTIKYVRKGYILNLVNKDQILDKSIVNNLVDTYFTVYPVLVRNFNEQAVREVAYCIDPEYKGVAEAGNGTIRIGAQYIKDHPDDFDLITHEVMHLVQSYPPGTGPWWITEGIADYVRYVYGVDNEKGGWALPKYTVGQNYENGYRVTARFFLWIENQIKPGFIKQLDHAMRANVYSESFWGTQTGMTLDELWESYGKNPNI